MDCNTAAGFSAVVYLVVFGFGIYAFIKQALMWRRIKKLLVEHDRPGPEDSLQVGHNMDVWRYRFDERDTDIPEVGVLKKRAKTWLFLFIGSILLGMVFVSAAAILMDTHCSDWLRDAMGGQ